MERQLTHGPQSHDLDNNDNFTSDDRWLIYDTRDSDTAIATNAVIGRVHVSDGTIEELYREPFPTAWGPGVGAASAHPTENRMAFLRGLSSASRERPYAMWRRTGVMVEFAAPHIPRFIDSRDVTSPFTPGALRGGTHRHEWSADGQWIGFTYNDALLAGIEERDGRHVNLRTIGVTTATIASPSSLGAGPENVLGEWFAAVVVKVTPDPKPGSDEISRAFEDAWVGRRGYRHADGTWQTRARAFLGELRTRDGRGLIEVFIADIPDRIDIPGPSGPLEGTPDTMPQPPAGTHQRRLTHTENRKYPGVPLVPRHWVRSSPDGRYIVFPARDDQGVVQAFLVSSADGEIVQVTRHGTSIQSAVRWSPNGRQLLYVCGGAVTICDAQPDSSTFGRADVVTSPTPQPPEHPVWSHNGRLIAFNRRIMTAGELCKQIFIVNL